MTRRRALLAAAVLIIVAGVGWAAFAVLGKDSTLTDSKLIGRPVPNVALSQLEGDTTVKLSSPGQVMVINFWAPWCVPCLGEHQMLNQTVAGFAADKVRFVGIAYQSTDSDVADFLDRVGRNIPTLRDPDGVASIDFGVVGVPETFFVDPTGIVRARVAGPLTQKLLTTVIDRLLQGQSITDLGN